MIARAQVILDLPESVASLGSDFWSEALGWPLGSPWPEHPEFRSLMPGDGDAYVSRQVVGSEDPGVHLDLEVADLDLAIESVVALGAVPGDRHDRWQAMISPGGLAFCLVALTPDFLRPGAHTWEDGHRSRLVQVCIDSPPDRHDREVEFWRAVTGWTWRSGYDEPEFAGKLFPAPGSTIQLLLHRLGADDGAERVRAHLDLGTDDLEAETDRLLRAGATRMWEGDGWVTLRDPTGTLFCVTRNSPDAPN